MSHAGKALMDVLETYPRDELFQTPVDELLPIAQAVMYTRERRQLRLFVRRDTYDRFLSCLVYLPRDRYTTACASGSPRSSRSSWRATRWSTPLGSPSRSLARLHFVVRPADGELDR